MHLMLSRYKSTPWKCRKISSSSKNKRGTVEFVYGDTIVGKKRYHGILDLVIFSGIGKIENLEKYFVGEVFRKFLKNTK